MYYKISRCLIFTPKSKNEDQSQPVCTSLEFRKMTGNPKMKESGEERVRERVRQRDSGLHICTCTICLLISGQVNYMTYLS